MDKVTLFWFRRDLRLNDNHALFEALKNNNVLPVFIFDKNILEKLESRNDKRVSFIFNEIQNLKTSFENQGSSLYISYDTPINTFKTISSKYLVDSIYFNHDYEPYALERDNTIIDFFKLKQIPAYSFKDQVIFEKNEVVKSDGNPYTIFTPYMKKWKEELNKQEITHFKSEKLLENLYKTKPFRSPTIQKIGFKSVDFKAPSRIFDSKKIKNYENTRNFPAIDGTSKLSIHLRFGTISIRDLIKTAQEPNESFLNELIWREFYMMILFHFPKVTEQSFKPLYDHIEWINNEKHFELWRKGQTGYPIIDAGMRELNETGFMHNRVRMITASFLTKHLLIDWRWGEAYFAQKLLDYELSSNNGGWQWAASSGCDAVPYFRIFSPDLQTNRFDTNFEYIRKWVSEFKSDKYPQPIVEHTFARKRAIETYKKTLLKIKE